MTEWPFSRNVEFSAEECSPARAENRTCVLGGFAIANQERAPSCDAALTPRVADWSLAPEIQSGFSAIQQFQQGS